MNIALCTDENFSIPALVCITSIFENNKDEDCHIYVLTDGLSDKACTKFSKLSEVYSQQIDVINIDKHRFDGLTVNERFPISMYYRFLLPEMLPTENRVLYLDCDIIVRHSLKDMYATDLEGKALAAVISKSSDNLFWYNTLRITDPYFNSGVLLMNLNYWREQNLMMSLVNWISCNPDKCICPDQDALNAILQGKVTLLPHRYNYQENWLTNMKVCAIHYSKWAEIEKEGEFIVIAHFCEADKPWFFECKNPLKTEWKKYAQMYDFIDFNLQKRYGLEYQLANIIDKIGLKFRYWADRYQKHIIRNIKVSK